MLHSHHCRAEIIFLTMSNEFAVDAFAEKVTE